MIRGSVWWGDLPDDRDHTQRGQRPLLLVQNDLLTPGFPTVQVVPFTSNRRAASRFACTLLVQPDATNGLTVPSVALVFQVRVLDKRRLLRRLGDVSAAVLVQVQSLLTWLFT
jgi:mRNA interferase MazF